MSSFLSNQGRANSTNGWMNLLVGIILWSEMNIPHIHCSPGSASTADSFHVFDSPNDNLLNGSVSLSSVHHIDDLHSGTFDSYLTQDYCSCSASLLVLFSFYTLDVQPFCWTCSLPQNILLEIPIDTLQI